MQDDDARPIRISGAKEGQSKIFALQTLSRKLVAMRGGHLQKELEVLCKRAEDSDGKWIDRDRLLLLVNSYEQAQIVARELRDAWPAEKDRIYNLVRNEKDGYDTVVRGQNRSNALSASITRIDIETFATHTNGRILVAPMSAIGRGYNILNKVEKTAAFGAIYFLVRPYPHPDDMTALARELNRRTLDWAEDEEFSAWNAASTAESFYNLRHTSSAYWDNALRRTYWRSLRSDRKMHCEPRRDLAANTAGLLVQSIGRLLRGGVPFDAFFVDAAFAPRAAEHPADEPIDQMKARDSPSNSLLAAIIVLMRDLINQDPIAKELYEPLVNALLDTKFRDTIFPFDDNWNL